LLTDVLRGWGVDAMVVSNAKDARHALETQRLSLAFSEDRFDDGTYRDLLEDAALRKPGVRVVVLIHEEETYAEVLNSGAFEALPLPCSRSDIQWAVIHAASNGEKSYRPPASDRVVPFGSHKL